MKQHAKISASRVERIMLCPGSFHLESLIPEQEPNDAAKRGTLIHEVAEAILLKTGHPSADHDVVKTAFEYVEFIQSFNHDVAIEVDLTPELSKLHPYLGGTADAIIYANNVLIVIDLKTGRVPVSSKNNTQLLTYALGSYLTSHGHQIDLVQTVIFQPGIGTHQSTITIDELMAFQDQLVLAAENATDPFAKTVAGSKQCKYCRAKSICPSLRDKVIEQANKEFNTSSLEQLIDEAMLASDWADAVKEYAKQQVHQGTNAGKWYLKPGRKMVSWKDKVGAEAYFAGNELAFEVKSPAALKKLHLEVPERYLEEKLSAPSLAAKDFGLE